MDDKVEKVENDAPKFDWVTERSSCSLPKVFRDLRLQVEADVKTRNALRPANSPYEFLVKDDGDGFAVLLKTADANKSITFKPAEHAILVRDDKGDQMLEITLAFNDQGKCRLRVNNEERELWQVRRMALEELLFQGY